MQDELLTLREGKIILHSFVVNLYWLITETFLVDTHALGKLTATDNFFRCNFCSEFSSCLRLFWLNF